jgi:mannose-6-phosphate isomerase
MALFELNFALRADPWGMLGADSYFGKVLLSKDDARNSEKLGEAWCGSHIARPSLIVGNDKNLSEVIQENPASILGESIAKEFGSALPFLLKILTIATPLSIQVHPNKNKAQELFEKHPERYKENSEKTEVAVAITPTKLLVGFRELIQIVNLISRFEPAKKFFRAELKEPTIQGLYSKLLTARVDEVARLNSDTANIILSSTPKRQEDRLFVKLFELYPEDSGVYQLYFLNLVTLEPGEGIFTPADIPHAYLSGELIECMTPSDFVIRAGLTVKDKDVEALLEVISYDVFKVEKLMAAKGRTNFFPYQTPGKNFILEAKSGVTNEVFSGPESPVVYFCLSGSAKVSTKDSFLDFSAGRLCLVPGPHSKGHKIEADGDLFRVYVNSGS